MPNIEQDFNQNVLNLIGDTGGLPSAPFDELYGDYIRLIVTDDYGNTIRTYFSNKTWTEEPVLYAHPDTPDTYDPYNIYSLNGSTVPYDQAQLPIYRDQSNLLHVKINDSFVNDPQVSYTTRNYNLRFDFLSDLFESEEIKNLGYFNPRFYITEISNSKKELRLLARHTSGNENLDLSDPDLQQAIINTFNADSGNYLLDFVLLQNGGVNNNILDFTFDSETDTENVSLIIRLYEATPFSLYDEVKLSREIYSTQNETILFIDDSSDDISVSYLDPDTDVNITSNTNQLDSLENDFIFLNDQTVDIWNLYVDYQLTDDYLYLTSEQQRDVHIEMNLYQLEILLEDEADVIFEFNNILIKSEDFHESHNELLNLLNDVLDLQINKFSLINENTFNTVDYITQIEDYFEEWDAAKNANNSQLANDLDYKFWEIYDKEWTENFQQNNIDISETSKILLQKVNNYTDLSLSLCNHSFDD